MKLGTPEELRVSVATLMGYDVETWPTHGNILLAVTAVVALLRNHIDAQPVQWMNDGTPAGTVCDEMLHAHLAEAMTKIEKRNGWDFSEPETNWPKLRAVVAEMQAHRLVRTGQPSVRLQAWAKRIEEAIGAPP